MTTSQTRPRNSRRLHRRIGIAALAIGLIAVPIAAGADGTDTEPTYTGCLDGAGEDAGRVYAVAPGSSPLRGCDRSDSQIALSGGDLTSVTAGTGLRAAGTPFGLVDTEGDVRLDLTPAFQLPQSCADGALAVRSAPGWECGAFPQEAAHDRIYSGTSHKNTNPSWVNISDGWANITDAFTVPAGDWHITASAFISHDEDKFPPACRLNFAGDHAARLDASSLSNTFNTLFLQGVVSSDVPFTVVVACMDRGRGSKWMRLQIVASEGRGVTSTPLKAHG